MSGLSGNLKFDIARQQLYCEYCGMQVDPYSYSKEKDAEETEQPSGEYQVTVFICPQCGGEIISEDTTAATFCSFCGGSVILDSRIRKERRPACIIPFTRTKEDCRAAYARMVRRAIFAPRELKDETLIEKFRGIYMPYWVYSFSKGGSVTFPGKKTFRRGDYLITDHYRLDCEIEEKYEGLAYDASSAFSDSLSRAIGPFDMRKGKEFVPSLGGISMKVLAVSASPRDGGNSDVLCDRFLKGAEEAGHETEKVRIGSKNISPCRACYGCGKSKLCVKKDDMEELLQKMVEADGIQNEDCDR